jgi:hypothetical protein
MHLVADGFHRVRYLLLNKDANLLQRLSCSRVCVCDAAVDIGESDFFTFHEQLILGACAV